jgi:hypothetical protein
MFAWDAATLTFETNGQKVPPPLVKAGAEAVVSHSTFLLQDLGIKCQAGTITPAEFYAQAKTAMKAQIMANFALAHGGFDMVSPAQWVNCEALVLKEFEYLSGMAQKMTSGYYGADLTSNGFLAHLQMHAQLGRSVYENEYLQAHKEKGATHARRVAGAVDHCPTCVAENGVVRPIDEVVPIGESECLTRCHCIIVVVDGED